MNKSLDLKNNSSELSELEIDPIKFFGFKLNPFYSKELKGNWLSLFSNRKQELKKTLYYIKHARTTAICSNQGIGKSSFLSYLHEIVLPKKGILSRKFNLDFEKIEENEYIIFLRRVLLEMLDLFRSIKDHYPKLQDIDYDYESARLHKTITLEENIKRNFGGKIGIDMNSDKLTHLLSPLSLPNFSTSLKGDKSKESKLRTQISIFNNEEIKSKIIELGNLYEDPVVFFIDELDKTGKLFDNSFEWAKRIYLLLRNCREIFELSNFIFVFALDAVFYEKKIETNLDQSEKNIDLLGIIEKFVMLDRFSLSDFKALLQQRLEFAEVVDITKFIDERKLKLLYLFARGNSRKLMGWYDEALFTACSKNDESFSIDIFFDVFEDEMNISFSETHRLFFIKLIDQNTISKKEFQELQLDIFIENGFVISDNLHYKCPIIE